MKKFEFLEFSKDLVLGSLVIDGQHKKLIDYYNTLVAAYNEEKPDPHLVIHEMMEYANEHFTYEESFIKSIGYPEHDEHKAKHTALLGDIANKCMRTLEVDKTTISEEMVIFVRDWIVNHIMFEDRKYIAYFSDTHQ